MFVMRSALVLVALWAFRPITSPLIGLLVLMALGWAVWWMVQWIRRYRKRWAWPEFPDLSRTPPRSIADFAADITIVSNTSAGIRRRGFQSPR